MKHGQSKTSPWFLPLALSVAIAPAAPSWAEALPLTTSRAAPAIAGPTATLATPRGSAEEVSPIVPGLPPAKCATPPISGPIVGKRAASNVQPNRPFPATWQKVLDSFTANGRVPGAVILVKSPDWGVRVGTTGYANLQTKTPISPDMQFRVGSVTKVFTAQTILQMEQEGKLKLTDPVLKYLDDDGIVAGIPYINEMTIGMLLQMTTGITNYLADSDIGFSPQITPQRHFDPDQLMSGLSNNGPNPPLPSDFAPGATYPNPYWATLYESAPPEPPQYPFWYYSNSNYILLGKIAEKVSGQKAEQVIQHYVMDKLGMRDTYFATDDQQLPQMHGYTKWGSIPYPQQVYEDWCDVTATNPSYAWTAGAIVSTPWDLLKFGEGMFQSDQLLNQGTKEKWFTFVSADIHIGWQPMDYGVGGLMQPARSYGSARGHGGAFPGYKTLLYYFFDADTFFVLASNTWDQEWEANMLDQIMPLVSSAVTTPQPSEDMQGVRLTKFGGTNLTWQAGRIYGTSYNVYWGTDADQVDRASPDAHDGVEFRNVPGVGTDVMLKPGATYYWRVDTVAEDQVIPLVNGPLWTFTTAAAQ